MDAHQTFKEHHIRCMNKARAADDRLRMLTRMHGIVPEKVSPVQIACVQGVALYGSKLWWDPNEIGRREDHQLLLNRQGRSTLGALPTTPRVPLMRDSGLTPAPVGIDCRQQRLVARLASTCEGSQQKETYNHPTSGGAICRVINTEHKRGREAQTMRRPRLDEALLIEIVLLSDHTVVKREAKCWAR